MLSSPDALRSVHASLSPQVQRFIAAQRVARLATTDTRGQPHVVPVCFALIGRRLYSPIDRKPKRVSGPALKRVRNIRENPAVAVIVDEYREDWRRLRYVLLLGKARLLTSGAAYAGALRGLRRKYRQYRDPQYAPRNGIVICVDVERIVTWNIG